jgi:hypothetical protein
VYGFDEGLGEYDGGVQEVRIEEADGREEL